MPKSLGEKEKVNENKIEHLDQEIIEKRKNEIIGILIIALAILSAITLFTGTAGIIGRKLSQIYFYIIGYGSYIIPVLLLIWGITLIRLKGLKINSRLIGFLLVFISSLSLSHIYLYNDFPIESALLGQGGGIVAGSISWLCLTLFGYIGSYVILGAIILIGLLLWSDILLISLIQHLKTSLKIQLKKLRTKILNLYKKNRKEDLNTSTELSNIDNDNIQEYVEESSFDSMKENINTVEEIDSFDEVYELVDNSKKGEIENETEKDKNSIRKKIFNISIGKKETKSKGNNDNIENGNTENIDKSNEDIVYRLPDLRLLNETNKNRQKPGNKSNILEDTLKSFGVNAKVLKVNHGPTITRYEIQPASGVKVSKIVNLADDIALALAAPGVRIEAPIPGKAAVGVEVPHMKNITVGLKDIIASKEFNKSKAKLPLALGMGIDGKAIVADLSQMPHVLVAGATGSGKSVCINTIITSILYKATPDEVKLLLIDPKKVELSSYQDLPHLFAPVVTDPKKAAGVLKLVVDEMENRYELFSGSGTRGIESYNKKMSEDERLPYIVVIIDELSDLMMVSASDVEDNICRLAQMARAAGIHLVIATQRPSVDVITGLIKANIPSRISFAVSSQTDSRTILDTGGAEKLLGKGDMLLAPAGKQKPQRVQGAFVENNEIAAVVDFVKNQANPEYIFDFDDINVVKIEMENDDERDELYQEAIKLVVNYRASISMLQRRLHIGHSRAARMIDMMEEDGIVGPYVGSKAREVLISKDELDEFLNGDINNTIDENIDVQEMPQNNL